MIFTLHKSRRAFLILGDSLVLITSVFVALFVKEGISSLRNNLYADIGMVLLVSAIFQAALYLSALYDIHPFTLKLTLAYRLATALAITSILLASICLFYPAIFLMPSNWLPGLLLAFVLLYAWHAWVEKMGKSSQSSVLIVGTSEMAVSLAREILNTPKLGIKICGFLGEDPTLIGKSLINPCVLGTFDDLESMVADHKVDRILIALHDRRGHLPVTTLLKLKMAGVAIEESASFFERTFSKLPVEELLPSYLVFSPGFKVSRLKLIYKRIFSVIFSITGLILSAPIMLITALAIKWESPGPVFFQQERVGKDGNIFKLIKFRSMSINAESITGPVWAQADDPRVTKVGRFIRQVRIDEIPQFINVLKGDMHFVGPRPERHYFVNQLQEVIHFYNHRHTVKPGITGWAQVKYPYGATVEQACEKLKYDLYYIKNMSILLDLWIVLQTVKIVFLGRGAR